ncbi:MAG: hypothetical protein CVV44_13700 [Spirochaetae bacterium HGW-Spirochaetae-1]|jgi:hypothetical protein|nr:MAG: hypothetical protein CVV44_13700 [Spirochaetae bacterium HGW-Spirochaetae-1]
MKLKDVTTNRECIQERIITVTTYDAGPGYAVVEGRLVDNRYKENHLVTGEKRPKGIFHNMSVRLLIDMGTMKIVDVEVHMIKTPRKDCLKIENSLRKIEGESIVKGFTGRVQELLGREKGCAHLRTLLIAMSSGAIQGTYAIRAQKPLDYSIIAGNKDIENYFLGTLLNTCYLWRQDGDEYKKVISLLEKERMK